jgi:hypothetical protein
MDLPRVTAFDGDDTLWHNETLFSMTQGQFQALLSRHADIPIHMLNAPPWTASAVTSNQAYPSCHPISCRT